MMHRMAVWRSTVDLPAMLGPVSRQSLRLSSRVKELGTKFERPRLSSTTGWRPSWMRITGSWTSFGLVQPQARAFSARDCQ